MTTQQGRPDVFGEGLCACGCGASLYGLRADALYASEACSKRARRAASPDKGRTGHHPLAEVREDQEQKAEKARWALIVREHMARTLLETEFFHADDLDPLGIPEEHCNLAGSQSGAFVARGWMEEVGRRASAKPSRKRAKSAIYRITEKGREKLVGVGTEARPRSSREARSVPENRVSGADSGERVPGALPAPGTSPAGPVQLPGLEESAAARNLRDAA